MADLGILARAIVAVKYAATGISPANWFGPNEPLTPMAPPEVAGRQYDYPVALNLNFKPRSEEPVGFAKLKELARNSDLVRMVIEGQKDKFEGLEWQIKPREKANGRRGTVDASILAIQTKLEYPDGVHDWAQWSRMLLEQLFVLDAVSVYRRRTLGGDPYAFELIDGATIKVLLDPAGRRPVAPQPAYQQVLKGVPAVNYTADELLYYPQNPRADHAYGCSRVEMIVTTAETAIERMKSQKAFFQNGNLSDGFFTLPAGLTPDNIRQLETMWNNQMMGGVENRRVAPFLPGGTGWNAIGQPPLQDVFDEWLIRLICFVFSTSPTPFLKQQGLGRGSAESDHAAAEAAGLLNIMQYVRRLMNRLLIEDFQRPDLEFAWVEDREFDPVKKSAIEDQRLRNGSLVLDEVRDRNGEDPLPGGIGSKPMIYTATGATLVDDIVNPPEPEPVPTALAPPSDPAQAPTEDEQKTAPAKPAPDMKKVAPALERKLTKTLTTFLAAKGKEIGAALGEKLGLAKSASSEDYSRIVEEAFSDIDWDWEPLAAAVEPTLVGMAVGAGKEAVSDLGLFDPKVTKALTTGSATYAKARAAEMVGKRYDADGELVDNPGWSISSATRDMLRSVVIQGAEEGLSNDQLAANIRESDAFSKARAETIARTESAKARTAGRLSGWKASGLVAGKQWSAAPDCCDECQELDGQIVGINEAFEGGDPPAHPNCRCGVEAVFADEMPDDDDGEDD